MQKIRALVAVAFAFIVSPAWNLYLIGILYSFHGVIIKTIECNGFAIAGTRGAIAVLFTFGYLKLRGKSFKFPRHWVGWLAAFSQATNTFLFVFAIQLTLAGNAISLHYTGMVLAGFLAPWFLKNQRLGLRNCVAILLVIYGVSLVAGANLSQSFEILLQIIKTLSMPKLPHENLHALIGDFHGDLDTTILIARIAFLFRGKYFAVVESNKVSA